MSRAAAAIVAVLVLAGCSHGTKQVKPKPTACERAQATAAKRAGQRALHGDVDGDGRSDRVSLVRLRASARCGAVLVVRAHSGTLTRAFPTVSFPGVPSLNGLVAIAPGRLHIVVTTWQGASTAFARVFGVRDGRISPLAVSTPDGTFPYEGSVTHFNAVDCVPGRPGEVVASGWFETGTSGLTFAFERGFYRVGLDRFELVRSQSGRTRVPLPDRKRFPEFGEPQPFPSCMRVRAAS